MNFLSFLLYRRPWEHYDGMFINNEFYLAWQIPRA